jgi:hypothetical protein
MWQTPLHNNGVGDQIHNSARKVPAFTFAILLVYAALSY